MLCIKTQRGAGNVRIARRIEVTTFSITERPRTDIPNRIEAKIDRGDMQYLIALVPVSPETNSIREELARISQLGDAYLTSVITLRKNAPPYTGFRKASGKALRVIGYDFKIYIGGTEQRTFCPGCTKYVEGVTCLDLVDNGIRCLKLPCFQGVRQNVAADTAT